MNIQDEEILGLLGPNGAGKTTLMLMMGTVYRPTSGKISVNGLDVVQHPNDVRKIIGIAFQDPRVDGILGAFDVLNWHLKMTTNLDKVEREDRVEKVMRAVDLWDARNKRTWLMSGGMRKKVEDCKVLAQRPKIAVFDEPTAFLDVPSRLLMWKMIRELRDEGSTVIVATNMMDEAERLSDNVAIVNLGKLVATGTSEFLKQSQKGAEVLELTVGDDSDLPRDLLTQFKEVSDVNRLENKVVIYLTSGRLLLPRIVETLTSKGVKIDSVHLKEVTLEDVFFQYYAIGSVVGTIASISFIIGYDIFEEAEEGVLDYLLTLPVTRRQFIIGRALGGAVRAMIYIIPMFAIVAVLERFANPLTLAAAILDLFLLAFGITGLSITVAVSVRSANRFDVVLALLELAVSRASTALYPIGFIPVYVAYFAPFSPVSFAADSVHSSLVMFTLDLPAVAGLVAFVAIFLGLGASFYFRRLEGGVYA